MSDNPPTAWWNALSYTGDQQQPQKFNPLMFFGPWWHDLQQLQMPFFHSQDQGSVIAPPQTSNILGSEYDNLGADRQFFTPDTLAELSRRMTEEAEQRFYSQPSRRK